MQNQHEHFSTIASRYKGLRTTDSKPVLSIARKMRTASTVVAADVGCGTGRYDLRLLSCMGNMLHLNCLDSNEHMLAQLHTYLTRHGIRNFSAIRAVERNLPFRDHSFDCVLTFNAIHHFQIESFIDAVSRVLKDRGYFFIYTRFRSQNARNIWGRYFPHFSQKENRLRELVELELLLQDVPTLQIEAIESFRYQRESTLTRLLDQAHNHHYSTFDLYSKNEFKKSITKFAQNLRKHFPDLTQIRWLDENTLLVIRKMAVCY